MKSHFSRRGLGGVSDEVGVGAGVKANFSPNDIFYSPFRTSSWEPS